VIGEREKALTELMPALRRFARALTLNHDAADELLQDCLERALKKLHLLRHDESLRAWAFTLMHRVFCNNLRGLRRRRQLEAAHASAIDDSVGPAQPGVVELRAVIERLGDLPEEQRAVIVLIALEEVSYQEAARILEIPLGTVMSRLARGREKLRNLVDSAVRPSGRRRASDPRMTDSGPISPGGPPLSDETICAFVDGQIDAAAERARIEALARADPAVQARIAAYQTQKRAIRAAFDGTLQEPLPLHLLTRRRPSPATHIWRAAAAVLLFVAGAGAGAWVMPRLTTPPASVVAMQDSRAKTVAVDELQSSMDARRAALSAPSGDTVPKTQAGANAVSETAAGSVAGSVQSQSVEQPALASAADALLERALTAYAAAAPAAGSSLSVANADDSARRDATELAGRVGPVFLHQGFDLVASSGSPLIFADKAGRRVALFIAGASDTRVRGFRWRERDPLRVVAWDTDIGSFALVGPRDHAEMESLARALVGQTFK
jgi:RNA polymerase sigma-70 factor (ECF subfamily)